jgi:two-component system sensor histidine kinase DevS
MRTSSSVSCDGVMPGLDAGVRPTRGPPDGRAAGSAEMTLRPVQDRDQVAEGVNDIVMARLFSAGLALEAVAGLMGDHRAAGKVQEAIGELDLAVRDLRDMVFDHHRPDPPTAGRRG